MKVEFCLFSDLKSHRKPHHTLRAEWITLVGVFVLEEWSPKPISLSACSTGTDVKFCKTWWRASGPVMFTADGAVGVAMGLRGQSMERIGKLMSPQIQHMLTKCDSFYQTGPICLDGLINYANTYLLPRPLVICNIPHYLLSDGRFPPK